MQAVVEQPGERVGGGVGAELVNNRGGLRIKGKKYKLTHLTFAHKSSAELTLEN